MTSGWSATRKAMTGLLLAGMGTAMVPITAAAQSDDARLRRMEAELRALQRAVFPGGDGRFFTPEVDTSQPQPQPPQGSPAANSTLTDVLAPSTVPNGRLFRGFRHVAALEPTSRSRGSAGAMIGIATPMKPPRVVVRVFVRCRARLRGSDKRQQLQIPMA